MMTSNQIDIVYFAWVRERVGHPRERISSRATTVMELIDELRLMGPEYEAAFADIAALRVAVDQQLVTFDAQVGEASEVAFFPPMTGG